MAIFDNLGAKPDQINMQARLKMMFLLITRSAPCFNGLSGGEGHDVASFAVNRFTKDLFNVQLTPTAACMSPQH